MNPIMRISSILRTVSAKKKVVLVSFSSLLTISTLSDARTYISSIKSGEPPAGRTQT